MDPDFEYQLQCEAEAKRRGSEGRPTALSLADAAGTYIDPQDGTAYEWDETRRAWFPKVDDNFLAIYQASYGLTPLVPSTDQPVGTSKEGSRVTQTERVQLDKVHGNVDEFDDEEYEQVEVGSSRDKKRKKISSSHEPSTVPKQPEKKKAAEPPAWFEVSDEHNRNVYVSNLPENTSEDEFVEFMQKCGIVMRDPRTNKPKIKMYKSPEGVFKGDALCTYMKIESVPLALQILDGYEFNRKKIKVEVAKFNVKGQFDAEKAKAGRLKKNEKKRLEKAETKLLDWRPDKLPGGRPKSEKTVVILNMFDSKEFESDPGLILEFKQDLQPECEKFGEVRKITIYDRSPEGVATIAFSEFDAADACLRRMHGRFFAGKQLSATLWDGKTKYRVEETEEEREKRLGQWNSFLTSSKTDA